MVVGFGLPRSQRERGQTRLIQVRVLAAVAKWHLIFSVFAGVFGASPDGDIEGSARPSAISAAVSAAMGNDLRRIKLLGSLASQPKIGLSRKFKMRRLTRRP